VENYCPACDSHFDCPVENQTYDGKWICDVCAQFLYTRCKQCRLYYPVYGEAADENLCPDCLHSYLEDDE